MSTHFLPGSGAVSPGLSLPISIEEAIDFVTKRAQALVGELVKKRGREEPPFLGEELAYLQGIKKIEKTDLGEIDALLIRHQDGYIIKINSSHHPFRQNFSCAHEIGHTILHELDRPLCVDCDEFRQTNSNAVIKAMERLCDIAAAELLMPEKTLKKYLAGFDLSISTIERLAHIFKVSIQAAAIRISQISTEPCSVILWKQCQKPRSKGFFGYFMRKPIYISDRIPSPVSRAFESNMPIKSFKGFEINDIKKRCQMESKAFGQGKTKYVISLVFLGR
ncbi:MAG: ImmA/IrrE family metallo-endopeptidase [Dehalococcoidia bacterium]|nr:ImmA/IrrE family metallo-endopeptidase [Dehalococcoidia bacterium]